MEIEQLELIFTPKQIEAIELMAKAIVSQQETRIEEFNGWVGMEEFEKQSNRSSTKISEILCKPSIRKRADFENGGWVYYPKGKGDRWSFKYKPMMEFINLRFYHEMKGK
ncbi:DUF771 domain-containing protein [Lactococcus fujiensis]|uniref:Uncharacterized protein n=1 Tax=Lactococcus fujiensis JCM 16395 TaxID=1291764 RepID=A0A2A5RJ31_9LACT|nr:DUF771 domain-containing protein [Lactococcus fujiensis]PCR99080.1 hypothetical protein RT41_GL000524 [Lactococcus fujiensis JCM 16395]